VVTGCGLLVLKGFMEGYCLSLLIIGEMVKGAGMGFKWA